jgi:anti-anti-sigma factor
MRDGTFPVTWMGRQAIVTLPEHIDVSNAGQFREQLLSVINRGSSVLIADMTTTLSCDHAGVDAVARAYQRAVVSGTQLRLVVTALVVRRVLGVEGLDRMVSIYPSLEAAIAAGTPETGVPTLAVAGPGPGSHPGASGHPAAKLATGPTGPAGPRPAIPPALLWQLIDALGDGLALTDADGQITLVNRRLAHMFGYQQAELIGCPIESLVPADLREAHRSYRAAYARAPQARPMGERARLVGLRNDGVTFPVEISLSPVPTAGGNFILAVVRDATQTRRRGDLADLARAAAAEQTHRVQELLDRVVQSLFQAGHSLQTAIDPPREVARERITEALGRLDDTIREIREYVFSIDGQEAPPADPAPPGDGV